MQITGLAGFMSTTTYLFMLLTQKDSSSKEKLDKLKEKNVLFVPRAAYSCCNMQIYVYLHMVDLEGGSMRRPWP